MIYLLDDPLFQSAMMDPFQAMSSPAAMGMYQGMPHHGMPHHHHRHHGKMGQHLYGDPWSLMPAMFDAALAMPAAGMGVPNLNVKFDDKDNNYIVEAQTPGVKREELKIEIVGRRTLEVSVEHGAHDVSQREKKEDEPRKRKAKKGKGKKATEGQQQEGEQKQEGEAAAATNEKKEGDEEEGEGEITYKFFGSVILPDDADTTKASVEYADGLLR
jgi:HSP20 family molecular chaperone IbpA